jgi:hypothetical protein
MKPNAGTELLARLHSILEVAGSIILPETGYFFFEVFRGLELSPSRGRLNSETGRSSVK